MIGFPIDSRASDTPLLPPVVTEDVRFCKHHFLRKVGAGMRAHELEDFVSLLGSVPGRHEAGVARCKCL